MTVSHFTAQNKYIYVIYINKLTSIIIRILGYSKAMITPNNVELGYLHKTFCSHFTPSTDVETCKELAQSLGNITIITKGVRDIITNGNVTISCNCQGSPRYYHLIGIIEEVTMEKGKNFIKGKKLQYKSEEILNIFSCQNPWLKLC